MVSRFRIEEMDCAVEEGLIRGKLESLAGVQRLDFQLLERMLTVHHSLQGPQPLADAIRGLGFDPVAQEAGQPAEAVPGGRKPWWPLLLAGVLAVGAEVFDWLSWLSPWLSAGFAVAAVAASGRQVYFKGWIALKNRTLNINALMSLAVTGAVALGQWPEAAMVMVLFAVAERIEVLSLDSARKAIGGLMELNPTWALVKQPDGSWAKVESALVEVGAVVRVAPGERVTHDGAVLAGHSSIDQSSITGESLPVEKGPSDLVFAGTVNQEAELEVLVKAAASQSTLARIIHLVEEAQGSRAPTQRWVDAFAAVYTPLVFALAVATAVIPPLFFGGVWFEWIYKALVVMVIACPCALVVSTPVTIVSALTTAARAGILIKGGGPLELGRRLACVAFDKTGTVTKGRPQVVETRWFGVEASAGRTAAVGLAARSDHPSSRAIFETAAGGSLAPEVSQFSAVPGRGIQGQINGKSVYLGNGRWMRELGVETPELADQLLAWESGGRSTVVLADGTRALGAFALADTVKESSRQAVSELHALGVRSCVLSGDNSITVGKIAQDVGIDDARGDLLPEGKMLAVQNLATEHGRVGMIGDGINDAPALAKADVGFAMGGAGSDWAMETADVVLMDDDLRKVGHFIRLSRKTVGVLTQNIAIALGIKAVFFGLTLAGLGTMWMAVFADMGTSLLVIFNGLRLLAPLGGPQKK